MRGRLPEVAVIVLVFSTSGHSAAVISGNGGLAVDRSARWQPLLLAVVVRLPSLLGQISAVCSRLVVVASSSGSGAMLGSSVSMAKEFFVEVTARMTQSRILAVLLSVIAASRRGLAKPSSSASTIDLACPCLFLRLSGMGQSLPRWPYSSQLKQRRVSSLGPVAGELGRTTCWLCGRCGGPPLPLPGALGPRC